MTNYQAPYTTDKWVHGCSYPIYFTSYNYNYITNTNYRYNFSITDYMGVVDSSKNPPLIDGGIGKFNPNNVLKNKLSFDFQPDISNFAIADGAITQYVVSCSDWGISPITTANFYKLIAMQCYDEKFDYNLYVLNNSTSKMLNKWNSVRKVRLSDRGTQRVFNGHMHPYYDGYLTLKHSLIYQTYIVVTKAGGTKFYYTSSSNSFYANGSVQMALDYTPQNIKERVIDVPSGPYNIISSSYFLIGYQNVGGSYTAVSPSIITPGSAMLEVGDTYTVQAFCWPQGDNGITSAPEYYEVVDDCKFEGIQLAWQNEVGGTDYFTFSGAKNIVQTNKKQSYLRQRDRQNYDGYNYNVGHNSDYRGETIYNTQITEEYSVQSGYLTRNQIADISFLFASPEVYARINDEWVGIIITNEGVVIHQDKSGLKNFEITFRLSNEKYI